MKNYPKRILSLLLAAVMVVCLLPAGLIGAVAAEPSAPTQEDYAIVDALYAEIQAMEDAPAKKNSSEAQLADAAEALVLASDNYVEGSLERNGNFFSWMTEQGIRCCYSPRMREIQKNMTAPEEPLADGAYNEPVATKGGWPTNNDVYLIGPYYGQDDSFTDQYKNEATAIASAIGDTDGYTLYSGKSATIDNIAKAVSDGAVVIFDSHGNTDYENGDDFVTGATSSYLCLTSTDGLTDADYDVGAMYYSSGIWVNGATIANHMTSNSPSGLVWMAICLGMATDTMCEPLREKGVEVVYGYSQSVTFAGDYLYEEVFWDNMFDGHTVAESIATMKSTWGNWDWSTKIASYYDYNDGYSTISAARAGYTAFPIVVSDEDVHPGQRSGTSNYGADSLQTVNSTYTLFSQYDMTVQVNNNAYGSASINGNTITAAPATGYFAQGYTVISGEATVTQNGNTFSVSAQSDCTIQINFAAKTAVTVGFSGATVSAQNGYAGDEMELPSVSAPDGFTFLGWMTAPLSEATTEKPSYYTDSFTPTGNTTLYALYSYMDTNSGTGSGDYVKVESSRDDWSGEYLIVYETDGFIFDGSLTSLDAVSNYQAVTITDNTISADEGDPYKFIISATTGGYAIQSASGKYIGQSSDTNGLTAGDSAMANTLSLDASGNANIVSSGGAYLRYNATSGQDRFRYYKSSTYSNQKAIALYLKDGTGGTVYYTGTTVTCEHADTTNVAAVGATCTEGGFTAGVYCNDCESYISGHEPVSALGHSYTSVVTPPTATEQGYTTHTCSVCGDTYKDTYTPALGETYTVSFRVPAGVSGIANMQCNSTGITLPTAGVPTGEHTYEFLGWVEAAVDNVTDEPTYYAAGDTFIAEANTTLIALYTYSVGGSGTGGYVLTDLANIQSTDTVVITVTYTDGTVYALTNGNGTSDAPDATIVTVSDNKLSANPADALKWNISSSGSSYTIYPNGTTATWLYCTNANNGVRVGTNADNNEFTIVDGYLYNTATSRYVGVYRTNPDWRCYTSINTNIADQTLGFYVLSEAGETYYTTEVCAHADTTDVPGQDATCSATGYTAGVYCNDCDNYISGHEVIPTNDNHANTTNVAATEPTCTEGGFTAGVYCNDCESYVSGHEAVAANGHSYNAVVTPPTATEQGYTTHTCTECGDTYKDTYTPALGSNYTLSFAVPSGVIAPAKISCNSASGTTLPDMTASGQTVTVDGRVHTFLGWVVDEYDNVTDEPIYYAAGATFVPTADTTLRALYTYMEEGESVSEWKLVTDASTLTAGDQLVIATNAKGFVAGNISSSVMSNVAATFSSDLSTLTALPGDAVVLTLGGSSGAWTLANSSGSLLGATAVKKLAWGSGTTTWSISISGGSATIQNGNNSNGRFLYNVNSPRFTTYTSGTSTSMLLPQIYRLEDSAVATTYYTTTINGIARFTGSTVTLTDLLQLNFYTAIGKEYQDDSRLSVEFSYTDRHGNTFAETISLEDATFNEAYNGYVFTLELVAAYMTVDVNARLLWDGALINEDAEGSRTDMDYSIRTYAMTIIDDTTGTYTNTHKTVAKAMLNYGTWAQNYFGVFTDDLANKDLTAADKLTDTATALAQINNIEQYAVSVSNRSDKFIGYSLLLKDVTSLRLYFTEAVTVTVNDEEMTAVKDGDKDRYYVQLEGVNAANLSKINRVVYGDMIIENLSVLSPAAMVATNENKSTNFRNAMIALILYAQSVQAL